MLLLLCPLLLVVQRSSLVMVTVLQAGVLHVLMLVLGSCQTVRHQAQGMPPLGEQQQQLLLASLAVAAGRWCAWHSVCEKDWPLRLA
jgi:Flp pilus assembly protein CpaB